MLIGIIVGLSHGAHNDRNHRDHTVWREALVGEDFGEFTQHHMFG